MLNEKKEDSPPDIDKINKSLSSMCTKPVVKLIFYLVMVTVFDPILIQHIVSGRLLYSISFINRSASSVGMLFATACDSRGKVWQCLLSMTSHLNLY